MYSHLEPRAATAANVCITRSYDASSWHSQPNTPAFLRTGNNRITFVTLLSLHLRKVSIVTAAAYFHGNMSYVIVHASIHFPIWKHSVHKALPSTSPLTILPFSKTQ